MGRRRGAKRAAPTQKLYLGDKVCAPNDVIHGVDPMAELAVIKVHKDGTVDVALMNSHGKTYKRINPDGLAHVEW